MTDIVEVLSAWNPVWSLSQVLPVPLFPPTNWWNVDVSNATVHPLSQAYIDFLGSSPLHPDFGGVNNDFPDGIFGMPIVTVRGSRIVGKSVSFRYSSESDHVLYPIPSAAETMPRFIEGGPRGSIDLRNRMDRHLLIVDVETKKLYELYAVHFNGTTWRADSGAVFHLGTNDRRPEGWTSADAAGLAIVPGLMRWSEIYSTSDEITHAFRVTVERSNGYVYPASHSAGNTLGALPMGARLRLKASVDISTFQPASVQRIFRALKRYGLIVADNGSNMYISGTFDVRWDNDVLNPAFSALTSDDFEVLQFGI